MKRIKYTFIVIAVLIITSGCGALQNSGNNTRIIRQAENTPEKFVPAGGISLDNDSCKSPMVDPRDGTQLIMVSSTNSMGNYKVPTNKYGVNKGELLRIDCSTGVAIGIVKE